MRTFGGRCGAVAWRRSTLLPASRIIDVDQANLLKSCFRRLGPLRTRSWVRSRHPFIARPESGTTPCVEACSHPAQALCSSSRASPRATARASRRGRQLGPSPLRLRCRSLRHGSMRRRRVELHLGSGPFRAFLAEPNYGDGATQPGRPVTTETRIRHTAARATASCRAAAIRADVLDGIGKRLEAQAPAS